MRPKPRGRRVLLWAAGAFLLGQLALGWVLDRSGGLVRFPVLAAHLDRLGDVPRPDVVFLGSSRTGSSVHDGELTRRLRAETGDPALRAFNGSVPVGDVVACEFVARRLLDHGIRPRLVVLELVPEGVARRNSWVSVHIQRQLTWADLPGQAENILATGNLLRLATARFLPAYAFRKEVLRALGVLPAPPVPVPSHDPDAGAAVDWSSLIVPDRAAPSEVAARTRHDVHRIGRELAGYAVAGPSRAALARTLRLLRANDVEVVLLGIPVASAHRDQYTPEVERAFAAYLDRVRERHGVRYLDCRAALVDEEFADHHHALPAGAIRFSRELARDHLGPYWRERFGTR